MIEIAPQAKPPVCKILDFGKFKYEQQKREKIQRKNQTISLLKEIRFHPNTDIHDFEFKSKHALNFLEDGNKVKAVVMFKGRELAYTQKGEELLNRLIEKVQDISKVETPVRMEGKAMSVILIPTKIKSKKTN